jgi:hypothetical protein
MKKVNIAVALLTSMILAYLSYDYLFQYYGIYIEENLPLSVAGFTFSVLLIVITFLPDKSSVKAPELSIIEKWRMYKSSRFPEKVKNLTLLLSAFIILVAAAVAGYAYYEGNRYETDYPFRIDKYKGTMEKIEYKK